MAEAALLTTHPSGAVQCASSLLAYTYTYTYIASPCPEGRCKCKCRCEIKVTAEASRVRRPRIFALLRDAVQDRHPERSHAAAGRSRGIPRNSREATKRTSPDLRASAFSYEGFTETRRDPSAPLRSARADGSGPALRSRGGRNAVLQIQRKPEARATGVDRSRRATKLTRSRRQGSSVVEQGTHKPLVGSSTLPSGTPLPHPRPAPAPAPLKGERLRAGAGLESRV